MTEEERAYFARRAETERANAAAATDRGAKRIHSEMAQRYQDIVDGKVEPQLRQIRSGRWIPSPPDPKRNPRHSDSGQEAGKMDIASTSAIERIARVLAGQRASINAEGDERHAADVVDAHWREFKSDAVAILKVLKEPDEAMERAGDIAVWQRMIAAALEGASDMETNAER